MSDQLFPSLVKNLPNTSVVRGIGGCQTTKEVINCQVTMKCGWLGSHPIKPIAMPQNPRLVILGSDFLSKFGNTEFDWNEKLIRLGSDWIFVTLPEEHDSKPLKSLFKIDSTNCNEEQTRLIYGLLEKHKKVFAVNNRAPSLCNREEHCIRSQNRNICKDKVRRLPGKWRDEINRQVQEMLANGIIQCSKSPYNSNVILTNKKDGSKRFVIDFRTLNKHTEKDSYPLPNIQDLLDSCKGCKFMAQLDLAAGYWGVKLVDADMKKTAFAVPLGKYEFTRMPFGLKNSQATFQRLMDKSVASVRAKGFRDVSAYVDNILITSKTFDDHIASLEAVLTAMEDYNLSLRADKCELGYTELKVLGYVQWRNPHPG